MAKNNLEKKHAKLSASGADKWLNCPGSIKAESKYKNTTSEYAEEGTLAHELADRALSSKKDANIFLGKTLKQLKIKLNSFDQNYVIEKDMVDYVQEYIDYVRSHEGPNTLLYTEERVDFSHIVPEGFGTTDSAILDFDTHILHIFDLKYGRGVAVYAEDNNQGKMYGTGLYNELKFLDSIETIRIHIVQPRIYNYSSWDISVEDLLKFGEHAKQQAKLALIDDAPRVPGNKQCQWCRAKGDCKALYTFTEDLIKAEFDSFDEFNEFDEKVNPLKDPQIMTKEEMLKVLNNIDLISAWAKEIELKAYNILTNGEDFPGRKLVEGTSNRILIDTAEKEIVSILGETESYNKKLIGLGDLEKKLKKKLGEKFTKKTKNSKGEEIKITKMDELTIKPKGRLIIVPESDKRQRVVPDDVIDELNACENSDFED